MGLRMERNPMRRILGILVAVPIVLTLLAPGAAASEVFYAHVADPSNGTCTPAADYYYTPGPGGTVLSIHAVLTSTLDADGSIVDTEDFVGSPDDPTLIDQFYATVATLDANSFAVCGELWP